MTSENPPKILDMACWGLYHFIKKTSFCHFTSCHSQMVFVFFFGFESIKSPNLVFFMNHILRKWGKTKSKWTNKCCHKKTTLCSKTDPELTQPPKTGAAKGMDHLIIQPLGNCELDKAVWLVGSTQLQMTSNLREKVIPGFINDL